MMAEPIYIGSYVRNRVDGTRGRVHTRCECPYNDASLITRARALGPNPMRFVHSTWFQYQVDERDVRGLRPAHPVMPEEQLEAIEPFDFRANGAYLYFPRDMGQTGVTPTNNYTYPDLDRMW